MNKPKQKIINWKKKTGWSKTEQVGYNQAVSDYDAWILERLEKIINEPIYGGEDYEYCEVCRLIEEIKNAMR